MLLPKWSRNRSRLVGRWHLNDKDVVNITVYGCVVDQCCTRVYVSVCLSVCLATAAAAEGAGHLATSLVPSAAWESSVYQLSDRLSHHSYCPGYSVSWTWSCAERNSLLFSESNQKTKQRTIVGWRRTGRLFDCSGLQCREDNGSMGHGSYGSTILNGSLGLRVTTLRCGVIFNDRFIANFLETVTVIEFLQKRSCRWDCQSHFLPRDAL